MADYELLVRNTRNLIQKSVIANYIGMTWTRRALVGGVFKLVLHDTHAGDINRNDLIEVRRNGAFEFAGVIRKRQYDAVSKLWTLSGSDITSFWLSAREINPGDNEFDAQAGVACETALKHYVTDHLVAPADAARAADNDLSGITFTVEPDSGRGADCDYSGRWQNLLVALCELGESGYLLHDVVIKAGYTGYEYRVFRPTDRTSETGVTPVVFSVGQDNVSGAVFTEDYSRVITAMYALGSGSGAARTVETVSVDRVRTKAETEEQAIEADEGKAQKVQFDDVKTTLSPTVVSNIVSDAQEFRREGHLDARQADTAAKLQDAATVANARLVADAVTCTIEPLPVGPTEYRSDWDLGDGVTVNFPAIGKEVERRIEEITVTLDREQFEKITIAVGARPQTLARVIAEALQRANSAQVA